MSFVKLKFSTRKLKEYYPHQSTDSENSADHASHFSIYI